MHGYANENACHTLKSYFHPPVCVCARMWNGESSRFYHLLSACLSVDAKNHQIMTPLSQYTSSRYDMICRNLVGTLYVAKNGMFLYFKMIAETKDVSYWPHLSTTPIKQHDVHYVRSNCACMLRSTTDRRKGGRGDSPSQNTVYDLLSTKSCQ